MKGISGWILVMGSFILGVLLFTVGASILAGHIEMSEKHITISAISDLFTKLKRVCYSGGTGEIYNYKSLRE